MSSSLCHRNVYANALINNYVARRPKLARFHTSRLVLYPFTCFPKRTSSNIPARILHGIFLRKCTIVEVLTLKRTRNKKKKQQKLSSLNLTTTARELLVLFGRENYLSIEIKTYWSKHDSKYLTLYIYIRNLTALFVCQLFFFKRIPPIYFNIFVQVYLRHSKLVLLFTVFYISSGKRITFYLFKVAINLNTYKQKSRMYYTNTQYECM